MTWQKVLRQGVGALCLAIIGHTSMDIYSPSHPIFVSLIWWQRTLVDAWAIWIGLVSWDGLKWFLKNGET